MAAYQADCQYCTRDERLTGILIEICKLEVSTLYLFREQTYRGRCVVALNTHETELFRLDDETLRAFSMDVSRAAGAVHRAFTPDKINYAVYGDLVPHLHFHIVPKYKDGDCWGKPFAINPPNQKYSNDAECGRIILAIKDGLST
jgi:diadenosine tetraphosphate (Ap4A) HIT family hydrolase